MAVSVPGSISGNVIAEYAATTTTINRSVIKNAEGFLISAFSCNINYEKKKYVIDENGNKLAFVTDQENNYPAMGINGMTDDTSRGSLSLDFATFGQYFSRIANAGDILGETMATLIDELIHADLVKRKILNA